MRRDHPLSGLQAVRSRPDLAPEFGRVQDRAVFIANERPTKLNTRPPVNDAGLTVASTTADRGRQSLDVEGGGVQNLFVFIRNERTRKLNCTGRRRTTCATFRW
jgi:hypothetical protein